MMGRKAAKSATVSEQCLALLKNSKTLAFKLVRLASGYGRAAPSAADGLAWHDDTMTEPVRLTAR